MPQDCIVASQKSRLLRKIVLDKQSAINKLSANEDQEMIIPTFDKQLYIDALIAMNVHEKVAHAHAEALDVHYAGGSSQPFTSAAIRSFYSVHSMEGP